MIVDMVRCPATDAEGYRCFLGPTHQGPHRWGRCEATDAQGYRCTLPPSHPGDHELAWYGRPTSAGERHELRYRGARDRTAEQVRKDTERLARHGWHPVSEDYVPNSWAVRYGLLAPLLPGELVVVYEYRPLP